ncbi:MAG: DNA-binding transcriptional regulator DsdC [Enterobacteriaceae bacterium]
MCSETLYTSRNKRLTGYQLSKLHTFEVAARHSSFSLAAEELSLCPSAVSHRITSLEQELGFKLFTRHHRKIELTRDGQRIFWALASSLESLNQSILEVKNQELSGSLTVYSRPSIAQCWLVPQLANFVRRYPAIDLTILTGNEMVNFRSYGVDVALYYDDKPASHLTCYPLMQESILPVCSPAYAEQHQLLDQPANLAHCTLLHDRQAWNYDSDSDEWRSWTDHFALTLPPRQQAIGFDRSDLAIIAAINHAGVAMGRKRLVSKRLLNQELIAPFAQMELLCAQHYYIATLPERRDPKIKAFIDWLQEMAHPAPAE